MDAAEVMTQPSALQEYDYHEITYMNVIEFVTIMVHDVRSSELWRE